ncbi:hypothetical protein NHE_0062 [Neorickettsia helminthoeca str. Oregon]|uniref:Uncharacterized protein n=1 Tax=Neorickettsia helminthoeca str. Oregon TaxID=1286528 RepID=X5H3C1_9RICK|nr:hypothetical protein NHE_0062 [Neorickettsia helminthoeca str. Oregon]
MLKEISRLEHILIRITEKIYEDDPSIENTTLTIITISFCRMMEI